MTQPEALRLAERMDFADGKYTVINDNGKLTALRYGEPWRDLNGDNLVYWMLVESMRMKAQRDALLEACRAYDDWADKTLCYDRVLRPIRAQIRAAIAKAEENT